MKSGNRANYEKKIYISIVIAMIMLCVAMAISLALILDSDLNVMHSTGLIDIGVEMFGMAICLILLYSCAVDRKLDKKSTILACLVVIIAFSLFLNLIDGFFEGNSAYSGLLKTVFTLEYLNDDLIVIVFWYFIYAELEERTQRYRKLSILIIAVISVSIFCTFLNCVFGFFFYVDENGRIVENAYAIYSLLPAVFVYLAILVCIVRLRATWREKAILLSFEILPTIATALLILGMKYTTVYPAYLLSVVLIYIEFYERRKKKIAQQEVELAKQSMSLLVSQIQPHFIYNTLTTISNLCVKDPQQAEETTVLFSQYLRGNLDSLSETYPIPFVKEMEHVKTYIALEKKRFGDKLNVEINLGATDFAVPALSLQPIVENSIKHGICQKSEPGVLRITSEKTGRGYEVVIEDDGVGYNPDEKLPEDGKNHVGLKNVISRLQSMCEAKVNIVSSPGNGCRTEIVFPFK